MTRLLTLPSSSAPVTGRRLRWIYMGLLLLYWIFAHYVERIDLSQNPPGWWQNTVTLLPLFQVFSGPVLTIAEFLSPRVLRHFLPIIAGWWLAHRAALAVLQKLYNIPDGRAAGNILNRLTSNGALRPALVTAEMLANPTQLGDLFAIGGPGRIRVRTGEVALTEQNGRIRQVLPAGVHSLTQFEKVVRVVDLRPHERSAAEVRLFTRDGIELWTSLGVSFRIDTLEQPATKTQPYPFDPRAVRLAAYADTLHADRVDSWTEIPLPLAVGQLEEAVAALNLDELIEPGSRQRDPHQTIRRRVQESLEELVADFGIEVIAVRLGAFELIDPVTDRRIEYWRTQKDQIRRKASTEGEALALEEIEKARVDAKIEMLQAMIQGINEAKQDGGRWLNRDVMALRLVEAIEQVARQSHHRIAHNHDSKVLDEVVSLRAEMEKLQSPPE